MSCYDKQEEPLTWRKCHAVSWVGVDGRRRSSRVYDGGVVANAVIDRRGTTDGLDALLPEQDRQGRPAVGWTLQMWGKVQWNAWLVGGSYACAGRGFTSGCRWEVQSNGWTCHGATDAHRRDRKVDGTYLTDGAGNCRTKNMV